MTVRARRGRRTNRRQAGFTLLEVLIAVLLAMIGLLGTIAVQQTVFNATQNTNDAQIAMRLATQAIEELNARITRPGPPVLDQLAPLATGAWTPMVFLDSRGVQAAAASPAARWGRQLRITNLGPNLPYNVTVQVTYNLDNGNTKAVRLDVERRKTW